jgi:hypothetical protein
MNQFVEDYTSMLGPATSRALQQFGVAPERSMSPNRNPWQSRNMSFGDWTREGRPGGSTLGAAGSGQQGWFDRMGGLDGLGRVFQGIQGLGQMYAAIQGVKLGKQQLNFARQAYNTNTGNQTQTYNTSLEDRIRARYLGAGRPEEADAYLERHRLQHRPL